MNLNIKTKYSEHSVSSQSLFSYLKIFEKENFLIMYLVNNLLQNSNKKNQNISKFKHIIINKNILMIQNYNKIID